MIQAIRNDFGGFARDYSNLPAIMQLHTDTDLSMRVLNTKFPSASEGEMVYPELGRRADAMGLGDLADRLQARLYSSLAELMRTARDDEASQTGHTQQ
jgi:hypothetical protein